MIAQDIKDKAQDFILENNVKIHQKFYTYLNALTTFVCPFRISYPINKGIIPEQFLILDTYDNKILVYIKINEPEGSQNSQELN